MSKKKPPKYKVCLVYGGRWYDDSQRLHAKLTKLQQKYGFNVLIHGNATGADGLAGAWSRQNLDVQEVSCNAHWGKHGGKAAGPIRNTFMASFFKIDMAIEFPGDTGTEDMRKKLKRAGVTKIVKIKMTERDERVRKEYYQRMNAHLPKPKSKL